MDLKLRLQIMVGTVVGTLGLASGCSTSRLQVTSTPPGADVSVFSGSRGAVVLGKTPMSLTRESVVGLFSESVQLTVARKGFEAVSLLVPATQVATQASFEVTLHETEADRSCTDPQRSLNEVAQGIAQVQYMIFKKNYPDALTAASSLTTKFPHIAVAFDLLGNIHYLQKDLPHALEAYKRSAELDPSNPVTAKMIQKLTGLRPGLTKHEE